MTETPKKAPAKRARKASTKKPAPPAGYFWEGDHLVDVNRDLFHQTLARGERWDGPPTPEAQAK